MKIQQYLKAVRNAKIKVDLISISFIILMIFIVLLLMFILLESVFYFSPLYKKIILVTIVVAFSLTLLWIGISYVIINQNRYPNYSWRNLASTIGKNIFETEQSFAVVKDGALIEIFSKEGFLVHSLKKILDYKPVNEFSDELIQSQLASKAVAFDHLTYLLLTQNRWLSP